jgi:mono/diheme cytochrome c family protein
MIPRLAPSIAAVLTLTLLLGEGDLTGGQTKREDAHFDSGTVRVTAGTMAATMRGAELVTVSVEDPLYKGKREYQGYRLVDVLERLPSFRSRRKAGLYIRFQCQDGYRPVMPLERALKGHGVVAIRSLSANSRDGWEPLAAKGTKVSIGPAYLVWAGKGELPDEFPWAYQLVSIDIVEASAVLPVADADAKTIRGFRLFTLHCLKCHTIDGIGGDLGPELNAPCSVTQYWQPIYLRRYIRRPASVRAKSKMPDFTNLSDSEIESICDYLSYMSLHKSSRASKCE